MADGPNSYLDQLATGAIPLATSTSEQAGKGAGQAVMGDTPAKGDEITPTSHPGELLVGTLPSLYEAAPAVLGNEVGAIGSDVGAIRMRPNVWAPIEGSPAAQIMAKTGADKAASPQEALSVLGKALDSGEIRTDQWQKAAAHLQKLLGMAEGGPVQGDFDSLQEDASGAQPQAMSTGAQSFDSLVSDEDKYGTPGQTALAGLEGVAKGLAGPLATGAERVLGVSPEAIKGREEANPGAHAIGEGIGLVGPAIATLGGSAEARAALEGASLLPRAMQAAGEGAAKLVGLGAPETIAAKIGSTAVKGAIENMVFQGSDELSKHILGDPNSVETALPNIGLAGLIGLGAGGALGSVSPLWKATMGGKVAQTLKAIADKSGGIEGTIPDAVHQTIQTSGIDIAPEIKGALSSDPEMQQMFQTLNQSDTTKSGRELQEAYKDFRNKAGHALIEAAGRTPEQVSAFPDELSKYERGKGIGETLASEYDKEIKPITEEFDKLKARYAPAELVPDQFIPGTIDAANPYTPGPPTRPPGTVTKIANDLATLADQQGWMQSPSSDIMREMNRTLKEITHLKTLKDLGTYQTRLGENTASTLPFGQQTPLSRAGQLMKNVLRDAESDLAIEKLGSEAPELVKRYQSARLDYRNAALIKDALNSRVKVGGSVSGFGKGLREMARTDGEAIANRLSGHNDAELLKVLQERFPETAQAVRQYHVDQALSAAAKGAKGEETINSTKLLKTIQNMSPEVRNFAFTPEALNKVNAVGQLLEHFNAMPHNFSNTARTMDKLLAHIPGSAISLAAMITGHNPLIGVIMAPIAKMLGKDAPDALKLATLKYLGSSKPIESEGFHAAASLIHSTMKGEAIVNKAAKALFRGGAAELSEKLSAKDSDINRLDKQTQKMERDPSAMFNVGGKTSYYMPGHGEKLSQTAMNAVTFINSQRPRTVQNSPLDTPQKPTDQEQAAFRNVLALAQQPLGIINKIHSGVVTPKDVNTVRTLYPNLYNRLRDKFTNEIIDATHRGEILPYKTRLGLSMFMGQPLDSTMTATSILAAQPKPRGTPQQPAPKKSTSGLTKLGKTYQTHDQAAEEHQLRE